ncbi:hypothetical protein V1503_02800 [Bacillus sp. SCS-151]|uniref:hypothetical protein n=1 Tax=Nanhaiella sioensis TaxID=3115293 RepID=UPI00397DD6F0
MEGKLKKVLEDVANLHSFPKEINIQNILLEKERGNKKRKLILVVSPTIILCLFIFFFTPFSSAFVEILGSEKTEHLYNDYLIHNDHYYIPTKKIVQGKEDLDTQLGEVIRSGEWNLLKEGDIGKSSNFNTGAKYYSLKNHPKLQFIAIELKDSKVKEGKEEIIGYQILERIEPIEDININAIFEAKNDPKEVSIALENIRKNTTFLHEIYSDDLELTFINLSNDNKYYHILMYYQSTGKNIGKNIYVHQYEKGYRDKVFSGFNFEQRKILLKTDANGIQWEKYIGSNDKIGYKGVKESIMFEIIFENYKTEEVSQYINLFYK